MTLSDLSKSSACGWRSRDLNLGGLARAFYHPLYCLVSMETRQQAVFFHPPGAGERLFSLWGMAADSAKPSSRPLGDTQGDLGHCPSFTRGFGRATFPLLQATCHWGSCVSTGFGGLANANGHCLSLSGGNGSVALGCQMSPAPGHVYLVEAEDSAPMIRADSGHSSSGPWEREQTERQGAIHSSPTL